jgi:hypothetical protein
MDSLQGHLRNGAMNAMTARRCNERTKSAFSGLFGCNDMQ